MRSVEFDQRNRITTRSDAQSVKDPTEREFGVFLLDKKPGFTIVHEPCTFSYVNENGTKGTLPDFSIYNPVRGKTYYFEVTRSPKPRKYISNITQEVRSTQDSKFKQKMVMKNGAAGHYYHVFYAEDLARIQEKYREYNFFKVENASDGEKVAER